eukprot:1803053-Pyramimonas_sp.AAC.2
MRAWRSFVGIFLGRSPAQADEASVSFIVYLFPLSFYVSVRASPPAAGPLSRRMGHGRAKS